MYTILNNLPTIVTKAGKYKMRNGKIAIVRKVKENHDTGTTSFDVCGTYFTGNIRKRAHYMIWHVSGRCYSFKESGLDLLEIVND